MTQLTKQRWSGAKTKCHKCKCGIKHQSACYVSREEVSEFRGDDAMVVLCETCGAKEVSK